MASLPNGTRRGAGEMGDAIATNLEGRYRNGYGNRFNKGIRERGSIRLPDHARGDLRWSRTGLVAPGQAVDEGLRREKILRVGVNGEAQRDCALVSVAVLADRFVGARALWRPEEISEIFVASTSPDAVGLSSVVGLLDLMPRSAPTASTCALQTQVR